MRRRLDFPEPLGPRTTQISPSLDLQRQALKRDDAAFGGRVDAEDVADLDGWLCSYAPRGCGDEGGGREHAREQGGTEHRPGDRGPQRQLGRAGVCGDGDEVDDEEPEQRGGRQPADDADRRRRRGFSGGRLCVGARAVAPWASRSSSSPRSSRTSETTPRRTPTSARPRATRAAARSVKSVPRASGSLRSDCSSSARESTVRTLYGERPSSAASSVRPLLGVGAQPDLVRTRRCRGARR